jgi:DNA transformation protein
MIDSNHIQELFAAFGRVSVRRMFGGAGVYADGIIFAIVVDGVIYLKAAPGDAATFEREGCEPFSYTAKGGKRVVMSYWRMPDRLYDDPDELAVWARAALAAARGGRRRSKSVGAGLKPAPTRRMRRVRMPLDNS